MEASCTVQTKRNSCKFFSESDNKKILARAISKNQVSDPGPSWPSCFLWVGERIGGSSVGEKCNSLGENLLLGI